MHSKLGIGIGCAAALNAFVSLPSSASASAAFDGSWSVEIVAENGDCTDRYTVPLEVTDGHIRYSGKFQAEARGRIETNGAFAVSFSHEKDILTAKGSISGDKGFGSWRSPSKRCDGTWTAHKR